MKEDEEAKALERKAQKRRETERLAEKIFKGNLASAMMERLVKEVTRKFQEPPEAARPTLPWRLFPFKSNSLLRTPFLVR